MEMNKIACPDCGQMLELVPKEGNPLRVVAFHNCGNRGTRQVYETDAPDWPPPLLSERLAPLEPSRKRRK